MIREYFLPLRSISLHANATLYRPTQQLPERVTLESAALDVMTDLQQMPAQLLGLLPGQLDLNQRRVGEAVRAVPATP